jgi:hypothetical protein
MQAKSDQKRIDGVWVNSTPSFALSFLEKLVCLSSRQQGYSKFDNNTNGTTSGTTSGRSSMVEIREHLLPKFSEYGYTFVFQCLHITPEKNTTKAATAVAVTRKKNRRSRKTNKKNTVVEEDQTGDQLIGLKDMVVWVEKVRGQQLNNHAHRTPAAAASLVLRPARVIALELLKLRAARSGNSGNSGDSGNSGNSSNSGRTRRVNDSMEKDWERRGGAEEEDWGEMNIGERGLYWSFGSLAWY